MEISPEAKDSIKSALSLFMGEEKSVQFMSLNYAITQIKEGKLSWQSPVSIGVHALYLLEADNENAKTILQDLIGHSLEPLEALLESLISQLNEKEMKDERERVIFHTRFALGCLLLAKGDKQRSRKIFHEVMSTQLSLRGSEFRNGPGIIKWTRDIALTKWLIAACIYSEYLRQGNFNVILFFLTEAIACSYATSLIIRSHDVLDLWTADCEKTDNSQEYDGPTLEWLDLFPAAADLIAICQNSDSSGATPDQCKKESIQFLAWKFGQLVARFAYSDIRWRENPLEKIITDINALKDVYEGDEFYRKWHTMGVVASLLCEYDLKRDWQKLREHYVNMWEQSYTCTDMQLSEIGPRSDLYWAVRIGFADKILELVKKGGLIKTGTELPRIIQTIESIKDIVTNMSLRSLKHQQSTDRRLPPEKQEIKQFLLQHMAVIGEDIPSKVINALMKAERYFRTKENDDDAKVWF